MGIDLDDFGKILDDHMENQPYRVICSVCGNSLDFNASYDRDYDLSIEVNPCSKCMEGEN